MKEVLILLLSCLTLRAGDYAWNFETNAPLFYTNVTFDKGIVFNGMSFRGSNSYAQITNFSSFADFSSGSISIWFNAKTNGGLLTLESNMLSVLTVSLGHPGYNTTMQLYFTIIVSDVGVPLCFNTVEDLKTDQWYNFILVVGTNANTAYLNGMEIKNRRYNYGNMCTSKFFNSFKPTACSLGKPYQNGSWYSGQIDELLITQKVMTAEEALDYYNSIVHAQNVRVDRNGMISWSGYPDDRYNVWFTRDLRVPFSKLFEHLSVTNITHDLQANGFFKVTRDF